MSTQGRIYLDHNATAPMIPAARAAIEEALRLTGNASSIHAEGRAVRDVVERARNRVAALMVRPREQIVLASGGTEANAIGIRTLAAVAVARGLPRVVAMSGLDHPSLRGAVRALGWPIVPIGEPAGIVALTWVNHELGTVEDPAIIAAARAMGALIHVDAVQAAGRTSLAIDADSIAISAHKIGGPQGIGAVGLVIDAPTRNAPTRNAPTRNAPTRNAPTRNALTAPAAPAAPTAPTAPAAPAARAVPAVPAAPAVPAVPAAPAKRGRGEHEHVHEYEHEYEYEYVHEYVDVDVDVDVDRGHQERGRRPGTENVLGIAGFGAAAGAVDLVGWPAVAALGQRLEDGLVAIGARIHGADRPRIGGTINAAFPGARGESIVIALDLAGVAVSTGAACTSGSVQPSAVLMALGYPVDQAREAIRFSLGRSTTPDEIDRVLTLLPAIVDRARARARR